MYLLSASVIFIILIRGYICEHEIELTEENYNITWMWMANGDDLPEIAYLVEPPAKARLLPAAEVIEFELYTKSFLAPPILFSYWLSPRKKRETWSQITQNFDPALDTKILVHGWKSSSQSNTIQNIKNEYLKKGKYNIIAVNWMNQADNIYYLEPARYTVQVGKAISNLIDLLVEQRSADPLKIHLIGHSLGAHIMGYAGSYSRYRVSRISGLDPARPAFEGATGPEGHLDPTDAEFVDVIHSCAGILGFEKPLGFVDFYPNGGNYPQPGCGENLYQIITGCSHGRSHQYFAESINTDKGFYAYPCDSMVDIKNRTCSMAGDAILMGDKVPLTARGTYFLKTNKQPDFAIGLLLP